MNEYNPLDFQPSLGEISDEVQDEQKVEEVAEEVPSTNSVSNTNTGIYAFSCPFCHSVFSVNNLALGVYCVYCGSKGVKKVDSIDYSNSMVLPFIDTPKDAIQEFKKKIRFNPLVPFYLRSSKTYKKIRKVYLVSTLCDYDVLGNVSFIGADKVQNIKGAPMQTFESMYSTSFRYENLLSSNFSRIEDEIVSTISNYNFTALQPYNLNVLNGSFILDGGRSTVDVANSFSDKVLKHAVSVVRGSVNHSLKKVGSSQLQVQPSSVRTVLVPVYFLNIRDKGKDTLFLMNGQSGKSFVELPISVVSVIVYSILVFGVIFLLSYLVAHFL